MAQAFPAGHRLRLSISTSDWPLAWPPPKPVRLRVHTDSSTLRLPTRQPRPQDDDQLVTFADAEGAHPMAVEQLRPPENEWTVSRDLVTYRSSLKVVKDLGLVRFPDIDWSVRRRADERYSWVGDDMTSVRGEARWTMGFARGSWSVETRTSTTLSCTPEAFLLSATLDAYEGTTRIDARTWNLRIPRDLV